MEYLEINGPFGFGRVKFIDGVAEEQTDENLKQSLKNMGDQQLIGVFNDDVRKSGWVGARGRFYRAIRDEFERRKYDFSAIGDRLGISLRKVRLDGKKIVIET